MPIDQRNPRDLKSNDVFGSAPVADPIVDIAPSEFIVATALGGPAPAPVMLRADACYDGVPPETFTELEDFVTSGGKWGSSGTFGTTGGTVTWSIAGAGWTNTSPDSSWFSGSTVTLSSFLSFDFTAVLTQAFAAWSAVANINFVQVADSGGNVGSGSNAMIRIGGAFMDGSPAAGPSTLGAAFGPATAGNPQSFAFSGDIVFDSGEAGFWTPASFLAVATHEIGHSLGLRHTSVSGSLMEPFYNSAITTPQADDIAGIRTIYGTAAAVAGSVSIGDVVITEGNAGTQTAIFTVTRTGGTAAFNINFATANNTALSGSDYVLNSGTLSFGSGVNTQTISVTINGDTAVEPNESFFVNLSGATNGATISDGQGVGTIVTDDSGSIAGSVSINNVTITEGDIGTTTATFTVTRTGGTAAFSINYATANNSALSGSDYVATFGTLSFGSGVNSQTITVAINGDKAIESNETFFVNLSGATNGAAISDGVGDGTIVNDDTAASSDDYADSFTDFTAPFGAASVNGVSSGSLESVGDRDWFGITLTAGVAITIDLLGIDTTTGTLPDPYLYLYNGSGSLLAQDDDSGTGFNSRLNFTPSSSGTYYIAAAAYDDSYMGTYRISVTGSIPSDDYRDSLTDATALFGQVNVNGSSTGSLETRGDRDWFRVQLTAGSTYTMAVTGLSGGGGTLEDSYLRLRDSSGFLLTENDDILLGVNRDSRLSFTAASTGTYYLDVGAFDDDYTGTYRVSVAAGSQSQLPDILVGDTISLGSEILRPGGGTTISYHVVNGGGTAAGASVSQVYLSTNDLITTFDTLLATINDPALSGNFSFVSDSTTITLPTNLAPGTYYIGVIADVNGQVGESDETNNTSWAQITVLPASRPHWMASTDIGLHPAGWLPVSTSEFNNDGTSDVLWFNNTTRNVDLWKIANGKWAGSVDIGTHPPGYQPSLSGDFNGDGTNDVFWFNPTTGDTDIWKLVGGQWAGSTTIGLHPLGWQPAGAGDFNADGTDDVLWYNPTTGDVDLWKISGGQWAGSVNIGLHPLGWTPAGVGDFNEDGASDVAWFNASTGQVEVWLIANGHWSASVLIGAHPLGWSPAGIGDFVHNGVSDILGREANSNRIETWLLAAG